ncbi:MAG: cell division protein FtsL [Thermaerobacter sp.]|nr:cell division protein FtsL [Thermaerobacter sp.]
MVPALKPIWREETRPEPRHAPAVVQLRRTFRSYLVVWSIAVLLALGVLSQYAALAAMSYQDDRLHMKLTALQRQHQQLTVQAESLSSLQRIKTIAEGKLGMVPARQVQVVAAPTVHRAAAAPRKAVSRWWAPLEGVASFLAWLSHPGGSR